MNTTTQDISIINIALSLIILAVPILIFIYYKINLIKDLIFSLLRMILQLSLVAIYLEWIFKLNNHFVNIAWLLIMIIITSATIVKRTKVKFKKFFIPFSFAVLISLLIIDAFFLGIIIKLDYVFDARYLIPISGMILGNSLNHNIVGLSTYFSQLNSIKELYYFLLTNSGSRKIAIQPFMQDSIFKGLNPLLASMSVMGLISLPGMMTGQILGGSSPALAIKYQIMIMIAIFAGCTLSLIFSLWYANTKIFDKYGNVIPNQINQ